MTEGNTNGENPGQLPAAIEKPAEEHVSGDGPAEDRARDRRSFDPAAIFNLSDNPRLNAAIRLAALVVGAGALLWIVDKFFVYVWAQSYIDDIAVVFNLNKHLAHALSLLVFAAALFFASRLLSVSRSRRMVGGYGLLALLVAHSLLLWKGTQDHLFDSAGKALKCYVLTRDGQVRYLERDGVDAETGRACRQVTPEIAERLLEYQKGRRPERIVAEEPTFFEPRSGEPIVWFARGKKGEIELFSLMGYHPESGEELQPITRQIAEEYAAQREQRRIQAARRSAPPQLIADPDNYPFFDPVSGDPQVWYWRGRPGEWEFYDKPGFHPRSGEKLQQIDRETRNEWKQDVARAERERVDALNRQRRDAELAEARRERARQEEEASRQRDMQAGARCDAAAANPSDPQKPANIGGVRYEELKANLGEAIDACRRAVELYPAEPRYLYQYARALSVNDADKAFPLFRQLSKRGYGAAYDNLGSLLLRKRDVPGAIAAFKSGARANDPDSMVSLADLISRGYLHVDNPEAAKFALLSRAAQLGHPGAQLAVEEERRQMQQQAQTRAYQQQQEQMMLQMFGTILRGVAR